VCRLVLEHGARVTRCDDLRNAVEHLQTASLSRSDPSPNRGRRRRRSSLDFEQPKKTTTPLRVRIRYPFGTMLSCPQQGDAREFEELSDPRTRGAAGELFAHLSDPRALGRPRWSQRRPGDLGQPCGHTCAGAERSYRSFRCDTLRQGCSRRFREPLDPSSSPAFSRSGMSLKTI